MATELTASAEAGTPPTPLTPRSLPVVSARSLLDVLTIITQAVSVGDTLSLACHPASTTHSAVDEAVRRQSGVTDGLVRMSVGIEDIADLLADLEQALIKAALYSGARS